MIFYGNFIKEFSQEDICPLSAKNCFLTRLLFRKKYNTFFVCFSLYSCKKFLLTVLFPFIYNTKQILLFIIVPWKSKKIHLFSAITTKMTCEKL